MDREKEKELDRVIRYLIEQARNPSCFEEWNRDFQRDNARYPKNLTVSIRTEDGHVIWRKDT
jgi:hypothetical protein